jgi:endonuclease-3 related protein
MKARLLELYEPLFAAYGPQGWWPGDQDPFVVVAGAILTQTTAWANVERALANLRECGFLSSEALLAAPEEEIARVIHPAGYFNAKARKLKAFAETLHARFDDRMERLFALPVAELREALLAVHGIGPETADDIILYAARKPVFVVDAYTRRILARLGIRPRKDDYAGWQALFMDALPPDVALFNEYHALLVRHAKVSCRKMPLCGGCVLLARCPMGRAGLQASPVPAL